MAPLPRNRLAETSPFDVLSIGVDVCGQLYSRTSSRSSTKLFIAVFSCPATRTVHLKLTSDLSTRTFLPSHIPALQIKTWNTIDCVFGKRQDIPKLRKTASSVVYTRDTRSCQLQANRVKIICCACSMVGQLLGARHPNHKELAQTLFRTQMS
ncbi:hypothetical protein HPB48_014384 [Haemaphysalis longicornis]|uniref:Uncharacterized protein n=1 Tax=Haemaphysalis longicornis TaxID=44386 RepID=A0A9J6F6K4_HAELO|nr:hypothetical protein HPB48_014384 [Haemaphysalis longicornis]